MNNALAPKHAEIALKSLKYQAYQHDAVQLCSIALDDERFPIWSGSSKPFQHHYGKHGLIIHTQEVIQLCQLNNGFYGRTTSDNNEPIDARKLFLAALFHDVGKMWDYEPLSDILQVKYSEWQGTSHKRHIHHISRSALVWQEAVIKNPADWLTTEFSDDVLHAILAHHGLREWGSPVSPNTKLAWMLHLCDGISARMDDAERWDRIEHPVSKSQ